MSGEESPRARSSDSDYADGKEAFEREDWPRQKGALEYLGEAYLELGRIEAADAVFLRLAGGCRFVVMAFDNNGWQHGCPELDDLALAYAGHGVKLPSLR